MPRHLDLRSGQPVWASRGMPRIPSSPLDGDRSADVAIVGGGVSGALVADALLQAGLTVIAIDRREFGRGSSAASTALLATEIDRPLTRLADEVGWARAARAYWRSALAVAELRNRVRDLGLRANLQARPSIYLPGNLLGLEALRRECEARQRIGLRCRFIEGDELESLAALQGRGAILTAGSAEADPLRLVGGLWRSALARGAALHAPAEAREVRQTRRGVTITMADGIRIRAGHAVFATGYELLPFVPDDGSEIHSTWAIATAPQAAPPWPSRALVWEASEPYFYARTTPDGRVIAGGGDGPFADDDQRDAEIPKKSRAIARRIGAMWPALDPAPEYRWAGSFGQSRTGLPTIGRIPGLDRCHAVLGYGGNGFTFSAIAAQIISRAIIGLPDPDEALFAFRR
ncbi:NAD(P)/FAD-dependent oxidoreductase [Inquilinus sp. CA228]|uniref:NAD(P)/FAD-dependent oxidoreductase n=1 Tax=Inquilinus sp. CA228 TaxID=3455609 RepID=UPI003F8D6B5E